jgi:hypothetical protein
MLLRGARRLSIAGALIAALLALSACDVDTGDVAGVSDTCTNPTTIHDGFVAERKAYVRVRSQPKPGDPRTTWVCFRLKVEGQLDQAGRISLRTPSATVTEPVLDTNSRACASGSGNLTPGPHPHEDGAVGNVGFYLDTYANTGAAWLCVEAGTIKQRLAVTVPTAEIAQVAVYTDPAPAPPQPTMSPELGKPSSACYEGKHGASDELVNTDHGPRHVFLYTAQPSSTEVHVCARVTGSQAVGGHLAVRGTPGQVVDVQQSSDTTPCTENILTLSNPPVSLKKTPTGQNPPAVCVNGTRYTVVTGSIPPALVTWTPDP